MPYVNWSGQQVQLVQAIRVSVCMCVCVGLLQMIFPCIRKLTRMEYSAVCVLHGRVVCITRCDTEIYLFPVSEQTVVCH